MLKLHPPVLTAVAAALTRVLSDGTPVDKALLPIRRERKFGSRDRRLAAEALYEVVRHLRLYRETAEHVTGLSLPVEWQWILIWLTDGGKEFTLNRWPEEESRRAVPAWKEALDRLRKKPEVGESFPDWMWQAGLNDYAEDWPELAASLNRPSEVYIRVNTLKRTVQQVEEALRSEGITAQRITGTDALLLPDHHPELRRHPLYTKGAFEFQDLASQEVARMSGAQPGELIVDACAGAGGKTLHLAALLQNRGRLIAADHFPERMKQLRYRAERAGVRIVERRGIDKLDEFEGKADRVIIDAPCTATGTIARKPAVKWRTKAKDLRKWASVQDKLLNDAAAWVRPGGTLVFATCSIFRAEGEDRTAAFLDKYPAFTLAGERRFLPASDRTDGFYVACFTQSA